MGVSMPISSSSSSSSSFSSVFFSFLSLLINVSFADSNDSNITAMVLTNPSPSPPPSTLPLEDRRDFSPFKPSVAVVVGVLTSVFSLTFLLLLYAKHCKRRNGAVDVHHHYQHRLDGGGGGYGGGAGGRKNSGIDRSVIESLPVFRFGALSGHKDGLECAVCLARFEPTEVLRLLPKCKHAFHVECVDTWLDAHSTCPLCRYRVDPEDILLVGDCNLWYENPCSHQQEDDPGSGNNTTGRSGPEPTRVDSGYCRVSGRHSSAGERASHGFLQRPAESNTDEPGPRSSSYSSMPFRDPASFRRSLDSSLRKKSDAVSVGCFDRAQRKDGLLLPDGLITDRKSFERRFEHRIIISAAGNSGPGHRDQRWSDVRPSDLLYLRSEMILSDCTRFTVEPERGGSRARPAAPLRPPPGRDGNVQVEGGNEGISGKDVINGRSVSEITSMSRFSSREINNSHRHHRQRQAAGVVSRWLAWVSSQSHSGVRSHPTTGASLA